MSSYRIRPHHGLCTAFFIGKGYNEEFSKNMASVIETLNRDDPAVMLTLGEDIICKSCPNNDREQDMCLFAEKVSRYDMAVLNICGLKAWDELKWSDFRDIVFRRIIAQGKLKEICGDCQWQEICSAM